MARSAGSKSKNEAPESDFAELVHPGGERKETPLNASRDAQLRFDGWLPAEQAKLEAPSTDDSGSSTLAGTEKTAGSNG